MNLQPLIISTVVQALDGTTEEELLKMIRMTSNELDDILEVFDSEVPTAIIESNGQLRDLASNQVGAE